MLFFFPTANKHHRMQRGFTLIEIMVAMVIGMAGIIIMMQMLALFEGQKRTTTGGNDALNSGAIAMYGLQQNLQQAGYCFSAASGASITSNGVTLRPVMIDVAAIANTGIRDVNTNTITISYGNDACAPESATGVASIATLNIFAYAVKNSRLMQCDWLTFDCTDSTQWVEIASDIISMRAECIAGPAVRVALVTRNPQLEKTAVTAALPTWSGTTAFNLSATPVDATATALGLAQGANAWQYYRYKTVETLAPIRNALWTGAAGC